MKPKRKKRKKKKKQTTPHTPPVELESLEKRRDKYIGGRRDVSAFVGWREGGKKGGGGERRNVGTKRERLVAGVPGWGFGSRRRSQEEEGGLWRVSLACSLDMGQEINGTSNTNANSVSRAAHTAHIMPL